MARRGKVKYKDVVKKQEFKKSRKGQKRPNQRKTYSLYNCDSKTKNSRSVAHTEEIPTKIRRVEETPRKKRSVEEIPKKESEDEESLSSQEDVNELSNLIDTFKGKYNDKKFLAIESSSESEDDENQVLTENNFTEYDLDLEENVLKDLYVQKSEQIDIHGSTSVDLKDNAQHSKNVNNEIDGFEESDFDLDTQTEEETENNEDPFIKHLFYNINDFLLASVQNTPMCVNTLIESWPIIGNIQIQIPKSGQVLQNNTSTFGLLEKTVFAPEGTVPKRISKSKTLDALFVKTQIVPNFCKINCNSNKEDTFSPLQAELFSIINNYQDIYFPQTTFSNSEEIRLIYCLHVVNHIMKTRIKIIHHNAKLSLKEEVPDEFQDQGLVRPKV